MLHRQKVKLLLWFATLLSILALVVAPALAGQATGLVVDKAGTGTGTVTSDPVGINCGADCAEAYGSGTLVTLTATPAGDSVFAGWSGDADCSDGQVTINAAVDCTATFNLNQFTLTVNNEGGAGTGTVTSDPVGINCGADCEEAYQGGTQVTLTATPDEGFTFATWSGDCVQQTAPVGAGSDPAKTVITFTMNEDRNCTADFGLPVGGIAVPVNRLGLLVPWLGLAALAGLASLGVVLVRRRRS